MSDATLLEENFTITALDNKKYDRCARITANSDDNSLRLTLDINTDLYPLAVGERITMQLASTLDLTGQAKQEENRGWREERGDEQTLADMYDYVCYGKVYRFEEGDGEDLKVYVSFGGLLLFIEGSFKKLRPLRIEYIYLLIKK